MPINESLNLSVLFGGSVKATATTTIVDTSVPAYEYILVPSNPSSTAITEIDVPTYTLTANKSSVNEGDSVVFTLTTTMLDTGTVVPYTISGVSVSDINLSSLTGNFTTDAAGKATLTLSLIEDILTEGTEILAISINGQSASRSVTINDTSGQPSYNIGWYSDAAGTNAITQINEGSTAYVVIKTQFVPNGTVLNVSLSGTNVDASDFTSASLSGTITINGGVGYLAWTPSNDQKTEGVEIVTAVIKQGATTLGSKIININDTSLAPTYDINWYSNNNGTGVITSVNEGNVAYAVVKTTNVPNGTILHWSLAGYAGPADYSNAETGTVTINNNIGYMTLSAKADLLTEGNETVGVIFYRNGDMVGNKTITINDTSITLEVKTATFTSNYNRYTYKTSKPYGSWDVTAWEYIVAYGLLNRDAFTAVNNRAYVSNLSLSQIGTPGSVTLTIGGVTHTLRWAFSLFDLYEEEGEGSSGSVDAYLDFPSDVIKSITVRSTDKGGTYTATFVPIGANGQGFIARNSAITSEWYSHAGPVTLEVLSWTK